MDYVEYTTKDGDRWDLIAWRHYGDADAYERIIAANPTVPIRPALPGGITLLVPVIERASRTDLLPPWRR